MKNKRRRRYLVDRPVQFRYLRLVIVPLIVLLAALYCFIYYSVFTHMLIPEAVATTLLPAMRKVNLGLALASPILIFFIIRAALAYSNRIVGPIPRLEKELEKAIAGDYSVRIKTRDRDELKGFVRKINMLLEAVDQSRRRG